MQQEVASHVYLPEVCQKLLISAETLAIYDKKIIHFQYHPLKLPGSKDDLSRPILLPSRAYCGVFRIQPSELCIGDIM